MASIVCQALGRGCAGGGGGSALDAALCQPVAPSLMAKPPAKEKAAMPTFKFAPKGTPKGGVKLPAGPLSHRPTQSNRQLDSHPAVPPNETARVASRSGRR